MTGQSSSPLEDEIATPLRGSFQRKIHCMYNNSFCGNRPISTLIAMTLLKETHLFIDGAVMAPNWRGLWNGTRELRQVQCQEQNKAKPSFVVVIIEVELVNHVMAKSGNWFLRFKERRARNIKLCHLDGHTKSSFQKRIVIVAFAKIGVTYEITRMLCPTCLGVHDASHVSCEECTGLSKCSQKKRLELGQFGRIWLSKEEKWALNKRPLHWFFTSS